MPKQSVELVNKVLDRLTDDLEAEAKRRKEVKKFVYGGPHQPDLVDPILFDIEGETYRQQAVERLMEKLPRGETESEPDYVGRIGQYLRDTLRAHPLGGEKQWGVLNALRQRREKSNGHEDGPVKDAQPNAKTKRAPKPKAEPMHDIRMEPATKENLDPDVFAVEVELWANEFASIDPNMDHDLWSKVGSLDAYTFEMSDAREAAIWAFTEWYPPRPDESVGDYERRIAQKVYQAMRLLQAFVMVGDEAVKADARVERATEIARRMTTGD